MRRSANITAVVAAILWSGLFLLGRDGIYHIYEQGPGVHPNSGQIDYYIVFPRLVLGILSTTAWVANGLQRGFTTLGVVAAVSLFVLLPYLFGYTGGV